MCYRNARKKFCGEKAQFGQGLKKPKSHAVDERPSQNSSPRLTQPRLDYANQFRMVLLHVTVQRNYHQGVYLYKESMYRKCPINELYGRRHQIVRESSTPLFLRVQLRDGGLMLPHARASFRRGYDPDGLVVMAPFGGSKLEEFPRQLEIKRNC
ncbi:hypothetical protein EVAR_35381_1 [Eumeta japonica]|uniref:Uncharacterized protein n=1 Tax=Eumeta variegata TaxID=151549 RepID=A0A4C1XCA4_EUMVA|nr:hypothetical protein EVAR_35381_1 [Eumeta japonica]